MTPENELVDFPLLVRGEDSKTATYVDAADCPVARAFKRILQPKFLPSISMDDYAIFNGSFGPEYILELNNPLPRHYAQVKAGKDFILPVQVNKKFLHEQVGYYRVLLATYESRQPCTATVEIAAANQQEANYKAENELGCNYEELEWSDDLGRPIDWDDVDGIVTVANAEDTEFLKAIG